MPARLFYRSLSAEGGQKRRESLHVIPMSQAAYYDWAELPDDAAFRINYEAFRPRPSHPTLTYSMIAAVLFTAMSGATIAWKWHQYEAFDTASLAALAPSQADLPLDGVQDAQVVHSRLVVLTPPVYPQGSAAPQRAFPLAAQVPAPALVDTLTTQPDDDPATDETTAADVAPPDQLAADERRGADDANTL
jgi:hypothetical protein